MAFVKHFNNIWRELQKNGSSIATILWWHKVPFGLVKIIDTTGNRYTFFGINLAV